MNVVLVPIDGSTSAYRALSLALKELAKAPDSKLHLMNVQPAGGEAAAQERGKAVLAQAQEMTRGAHRNVQCHVRSGRPADEIAACAHELGCDFIIMGTRGQGAAAAASVGSVAMEVVRLSRVPVALAR
jgi:nucleotide-binding universal stress UspA family protein